MAAPVLALPAAGESGQRVEQRRAALPLATLLASAGILAAAGGLVAAYLALKSGSGVWPPKDVKFDNYTATTITITALMSSVTIEWAAYGIRKAFRGQAIFGFGITVGLGIAVLNALYFLIDKFTFAAGSSPYATVVYAMTGTSFAVICLALVAIVVIGLRAVGHQLTTDNFNVMRSTALLWHAAMLGWLVVYYAIYVTK